MSCASEYPSLPLMLGVEPFRASMALVGDVNLKKGGLPDDPLASTSGVMWLGVVVALLLAVMLIHTYFVAVLMLQCRCALRSVDATMRSLDAVVFDLRKILRTVEPFVSELSATRQRFRLLGATTKPPSSSCMPSD